MISFSNFSPDSPNFPFAVPPAAVYYQSPGDSYHQNLQYQTQYNYNQSLMDQGGPQFQQFEYQQTFQPPPQTFADPETWNISPNKVSYVVSICGG